MFLHHLKEYISLKRQTFIKKSFRETSSPSRNLVLIFKNKKKEIFCYRMEGMGTGGEPTSFPCPATREQGGKGSKENFCLQSPLASCCVERREQIGEGTKLRGFPSHWRLLIVDFVLCTIVKLTTVLTLSLFLMRNQRIGSSVLWTSCGQELEIDTSCV